jgi:DNA-directed RNA polymerase specialized sigma24 family protein
MKGASDEELLAAIAAGPGALPEFYRRHVARVTGMGVRRFGSPEDVADFVANVFLEVLGSADRFDPRRGNARSGRAPGDGSDPTSDLTSHPRRD